jgi:hypothetical protein
VKIFIYCSSGRGDNTEPAACSWGQLSRCRQYSLHLQSLTQDCSFSAGTGWRKGKVDQRFIKWTVSRNIVCFFLNSSFIFVLYMQALIFFYAILLS